MNALIDRSAHVETGSRRSRSITLRDTSWGFSVTESSRRFVANSVFETSLMAVGFLMIIIGVWHPIAPSSSSGLNAQIANLIAAILFVVAGILLINRARRGFRAQIQVDKSLREIRVGTLNSRSRFCLRSTTSAAALESLFLLRSKGRNSRAILYLRLKGKTNTVRALQGFELEMVPILERTIRSIRPANSSGRRPTTRTSGRFIRVDND